MIATSIPVIGRHKKSILKWWKIYLLIVIFDFSVGVVFQLVKGQPLDAVSLLWGLVSISVITLLLLPILYFSEKKTLQRLRK